MFNLEIFENIETFYLEHMYNVKNLLYNSQKYKLHIHNSVILNF